MVSSNAACPRVVIVDHYDSFTFNLAHALETCGACCTVVAHDAITVEELLAADGVVLSAGPCSPTETRVSVPLVRKLASGGGPALLGVCLGFQCIVHAFGGPVLRSRAPTHGKTTAVRHDSRGCFAGLPNPMRFARYNSLAVREPLPAELEACAWCEHGEVMAVRHRARRIEGVQFHPESHLSVGGDRLLLRWARSLLPCPSG
jgi:anthranilate synthase/aminodeoxychorismate synthase-like glutamine amidotransferase